MRIMLAAAVALCLTGCSNSDFFGDSTGSSSPPAPASASAPAPAPIAAAPEPAPPPSATAEATPVTAPPPSAPAMQQMASPDAGPHCKEIAKLRARDAAYAGENTETQDSVYNRTYAECMAWDARHRS